MHVKLRFCAIWRELDLEMINSFEPCLGVIRALINFTGDFWFFIVSYVSFSGVNDRNLKEKKIVLQWLCIKKISVKIILKEACIVNFH